ncbi:YmdB family metallophosphoesterase, partial [Patescibacteria group bacterium]|nr:YmdB family metallophosphoesterase [Patescibacteria group bacterium]
FDEIKKELKAVWNDLSAVIVDFHAEATSEKVAMGWYLDGQISALLGTHTHIGTADVKILPQGTGYITDIGMIGATDSVLGVDKKNVLKRFQDSINHAFEIPEEGEVTVNAVYLEINPKTKETTKIKRIDRQVTI